MIRCVALMPDGKLLEFDDTLRPGQVVFDRDTGEHYVVGPDLGDEDPRLLAMDHDHYLAYWAACNQHIVRLTRALRARPGRPAAGRDR